MIVVGDRVICANLGDSRALLSRRGDCIELSDDLIPSRPDERQRIQQAGGIVELDRISGSLAISRAFGDFQYKKLGSDELARTLRKTDPARPRVKKGKGEYSKNVVSVEPEIRVHHLDYLKDEFMVLASDGIYNIWDSQAVIQELRTQLLKMPVGE